MTADVNLRYLARSKIYKIPFDQYFPINHSLTRDPLVMMIVESYKIDPYIYLIFPIVGIFQITRNVQT
jgi:hypothetical protein